MIAASGVALVVADTEANEVETARHDRDATPTVLSRR